MTRSVVLLSGGIDSALCLALALSAGDDALALTFHYGQRNSRELLARDFILSQYKRQYRDREIKDLIIPLPPVLWGASPLVGGGPDLARVASYKEVEAGGKGAKVPFRNGVFISMATAIAEAYGYNRVWIGSTGEGERDYPDCSYAFIRPMSEAVWAGTKRVVRLETPFLHMKKVDTVAKAISMEVPIDLTWSCYDAGPQPCGTCQACVEREDAIAKYKQRTANNGAEAGAIGS